MNAMFFGGILLAFLVLFLAIDCGNKCSKQLLLTFVNSENEPVSASFSPLG